MRDNVNFVENDMDFKFGKLADWLAFVLLTCYKKVIVLKCILSGTWNFLLLLYIHVINFLVPYKAYSQRLASFF